VGRYTAILVSWALARFGQIDSQANSPREAQFGLKVIW
jgi:hypothetical protein